MLERITNQLQHPFILKHAHELEDPTARFVEVVRWYLSGWHIAPKAVKKPLNPVLGEYFTCYWQFEEDDNSQAFYVAEQTSHHPPKSSYFYLWPKHHIRVDGVLIPKSRFLGNSAGSMMEGVAYMKFLDINDQDGNPEEYEFTQPNMYARGILIGTLKFELGDHSFVRCPQSDLVCDIEFKTKGFISGTYNAIHAEIKQESSGKVLYEITGKWNEQLEIRDMKTGVKTLFFDATSAKRYPPLVRPLEEQGPLESRKLWKKVTDALGQRNHIVATDEKFKIEENQRAEARMRQEDNVEFHPKLFKPIDTKLQYILYKDIDPNDPGKEVEQVESVAPILPGQRFQEQFEIPAYKKDPRSRSGSKAAESRTPVPSEDTPLNNVGDLKQSLPGNRDGRDSDSEDEFVDA